jgi:hypothetical protein
MSKRHVTLTFDFQYDTSDLNENLQDKDDQLEISNIVAKKVYEELIQSLYWFGPIGLEIKPSYQGGISVTPTVECGICHNHFSLSAPYKEGEKPTQGYTCATYYLKDNGGRLGERLYGAYGSCKFDMSNLLPTDKADMSLFKEDEVYCDDCIQKLVDQEWFTTEEYNYG